jgi:hypothetical protein
MRRDSKQWKIAIDEKLGHYSDINYPTNDYANLKAAWNDEFVFMEKSYTVSQLANMYFRKKRIILMNTMQYLILCSFITKKRFGIWW